MRHLLWVQTWGDFTTHDFRNGFIEFWHRAKLRSRIRYWLKTLQVRALARPRGEVGLILLNLWKMLIVWMLSCKWKWGLDQVWRVSRNIGLQHLEKPKFTFELFRAEADTSIILIKWITATGRNSSLSSFHHYEQKNKENKKKYINIHNSYFCLCSWYRDCYLMLSLIVWKCFL